MKMKKHLVKYISALFFVWMSCCCFWCYQPEDFGNSISEYDCISNFRYKIFWPNEADSLKEMVNYNADNIWDSKDYLRGYKYVTYDFGPIKHYDIFDSLTFKLFFFCNGKWVGSHDYKFLNRKDVFTHIDFKEQEEGMLMFEVSADSICPGLSNYRITQYTDTECIEELNKK